MKSEANVEDLRNKVVSDGTMRPEDLIPKFLGVLKEYASDRYDAYVKENPEVLDLKGMDDETMGWVVDELFDELDKIAPEGCIFGATDGDGACYGFWDPEASESRKCSERSNDDYLQEVYDELVAVWDKDKFDMTKGYDDYYECNSIKITPKDTEGFVATIYVDDFEGRHPTGFDVVYHYPGDKGVGVMGSYEFQSTNLDEVAPEIFEYFDDLKESAAAKAQRSESKQHENRTKEEEVTNIFKGMKDWASKYPNDPDRKIIADNLDLDAVQDNMSDIVEILDNNFEWDGYGFRFVVVGDYEDDDTRDKAETNQWNRCYGVCEEIADLIGIPDEGHSIGEMNIYFSEEIEVDWRDDESKPAESKKSEGSIRDTKCVQCGSSPAMFKLDGCSGNFCLSCAKEFHWVCPEHLKDKVSHKKSEADGSDEKCGARKSESKHGLIMATMNNGTRKASVAKESEIASVEKEYKAASHKFAEVLPVVYFDDYNAANTAAQDWVRKGVKPKSEYKKSESNPHDAYYAKALQAVDRAIKMTHDQFDITGDVAKFDADLKKYLVSYVDSLNDTRLANIGLLGDLRDRIKDFARGDREEWWKTRKQGESTKSEVVSDTDPDDMKVGKFSATLLADDNEYVGSVPGFYDDEVSAENAAKDYLKKNGPVIKSVGPVPTKISIWTVVKDDYGSNLPKDVKVVNITADESKKSESLTLKQKELKDMVRYGEAEDITTLPEPEAKELYKKGLETVGLSRGTYGLNGALLRDSEGKKYAITARSSNLFYFI